MKRTLRRLYGQAPITFSACAVMVVVYLLTAVGSRSFVNNLDGSQLADDWTLYLPAMLSSPVGPLRAVGGLFLHQGPSHLVLNVLMIFLIGREVERAVGRWLYLLALCGGGLGSSAAVVWMNPTTPTVGASGAAYALMAMLVVLSRKRGLSIVSPLVLVLVNLGYSVVTPGVSLWGHLGGLIAGAVIAVVVFSRVLRRWARLLLVVIIVAAVALILVRVNEFSTTSLWTMYT